MTAPLPPPSPTAVLTPPGSTPTPPSVSPGGVVLRVLGGLLVVSLLATGTRSLVDLWFRTSTTDPVPVAASVRSVRVDIDDGAVAVRRTGTLAVQRTLHYGLRKPSYSQTVQGDELVIRARCGPVILQAGTCSTDVVVSVPSDAAVHVVTGAGDVHATDVDAALTVETGAGDITVTGGSGVLRLQSGAGSIHAGSLDSVDVQATSGVGDVQLDFVVAPNDVTAESGAGDVAVHVPRGEAVYRLDVQAGVGTRRVDVASDANATRHLRAHAGVGDVTIAYQA